MIREYLDNLLVEDPQRKSVVAGDLNEGVGSGFFGKQHLTPSVVDLIFRSIFYPARKFRHVLLDDDLVNPPRTAESFDFVQRPSDHRSGIVESVS